MPEQQVLIQDVHLNLMVNRSDAALPDDKIPAPVTFCVGGAMQPRSTPRSIRATLKEARAWAKSAG